MIFDDEIYDRITDDTVTGEYIIPDYPTYIGGYLQDKIISLFVVHESEGRNIAHFQVLRPYRRYARDCIKLSLERFNQEVYVKIPTLYQSVINFAKHSGFKEVGVEVNEYVKNGIYYNRIIMVKT